MIYRIELTQSARENCVRLPPAVKQRVKVAFRFLCDNPHDGEPLRRELEGLWKFRVGRFRIVYRLESERRVILVVAAGARKGIYSRLESELRQ